MGLDVYLYSITDHYQNEAHDREWNEIWERKERGELSEDAAKAAWDDVTPYAPHTDVASVNHPEHLFNRRYLRSSYNSGGFNRAVPEFLGTRNDEGSLYWIFEPMGRDWDGDEGTLTEVDLPKLEESKARALEVAGRLRKADPLRVEAIGNFLIPPSMKADQFLTWYREQQARRAGQPESSFGDSYSCREGTVFGFAKGLEVLATTVGIGIFGEPSALVIYRSASEVLDSYITSAEITAEFCDEAIGLIRRDGLAHISWSG